MTTIATGKLKGIGLGTFRAGVAAGVTALLWMQHHYVTVEANDQRWDAHVALHEERAHSMAQRLDSIDQRLARIDGKLDGRINSRSPNNGKIADEETINTGAQ